ncbi:MAG: hypothetical protein WBQ23_08225 [Bacteroidota bacterium]
MFERNIEETIAFLRKGTIEGADSITSRQIFASSIPMAVKRMFESDIDIWVREENERLQQSSHFRYDEPEMQTLFEQIGGKARDYAVFSAAEYSAALDKNVKLFFNYVCRPQWTLVKYLFAEREHAATDDILAALQTFWHYEYYQIILREYFEKKKLSVINVKKFSELIQQIDLEVIRNFDSRKTAHLSEPLFELFNIGSASEDAMAPIEALSIFYDDKNIASIVDRLDQEKNNHERMTLHDLVLLISDADFTLGVDISTIVNEQFNQQGVMKPERNVTAGQDFEVPALSGADADEFHRGDLGHENDDLDFVISEEEEGVIVQAGDHITLSMDDDVFSNEDYSIASISEPEENEDIESTGYEASSETDDDSSVFYSAGISSGNTPLVEDEEETVNEDEVASYTDESILDLESEFDLSTDFSVTEDTEAMPSLSASGEVPEYFLGDDDAKPSFNIVSPDNEIPDITLEELGSIRFGDEEEGQTSYSVEAEIDPYMTSAVVEELAGTNIILDDEEEAKPSSNDEIDWDKEAEELVDMDDINLNDVDADDRSISDLLPAGEDPFKQEEQLKPAEELLGLLDLDDFDTEPVKKPARQNDFPIIEDETPLPQSHRGQNSENEAEEEENAPSSENVIKEFGDLNQVLSAADRKKYSKKLFNKNEDAFTRAIQVLNGKPSWRQASEYIDELFIKYDVDMYSRLAVKFTDDVYKRYANKK